MKILWCIEVLTAEPYDGGWVVTDKNKTAKLSDLINVMSVVYKDGYIW